MIQPQAKAIETETKPAGEIGQIIDALTIKTEALLVACRGLIVALTPILSDNAPETSDVDKQPVPRSAITEVAGRLNNILCNIESAILLLEATQAQCEL